jgi:Zn-dependent protease
VSGAPLIGWAKPVPVNTRQLSRPRRDFVLVAAAGPASNLVMAFGAALVLTMLPISPHTIGEPNVSVPVASILSQAARLNVLLAVFNMVPIPPLDGGNVLAGLLPPRLAFSFNKLRPYGFLLLYALILTRGFDYIVVPPYRLLVSWLPSK